MQTKTFFVFDSHFLKQNNWGNLILYSEIRVNISVLKMVMVGFPGGAVVENLPANAGETGSSPGPGRSHMPRSN